MTSLCRTFCLALFACHRRRLLGALATCGAALLVACGPGVGGTGTGSSLSPAEVLSAFGANAAPLCGSALAPGLQCSGTAGAPGGAPASAPSAAPLPPRFLADDAVAARAVARVAGDGIELDLPCERLRFTGTWGAVPGQQARFYGVVQRSVDGETQLAMLLAEPAGAGFTVALVGAGGTALAPPRPLQPVPAAPPAACRH